MPCFAGPGDEAPVDYVVVVVTDQQDKMLKPQDPMNKLEPTHLLPLCSEVAARLCPSRLWVSLEEYGGYRAGPGAGQCRCGAQSAVTPCGSAVPVLGCPLYLHRLRGTADTADCEVQRTIPGSGYSGAIQ